MLLYAFLFWVQQLDPPQKDELTGALANVDLQLRKLAEIPWLCQLIEPSDDEVGSEANKEFYLMIDF